MSKECKSCGHVFLAHESSCPYCGSSNPNYQKPKETIRDYLKPIEDAFPSNDSWKSNSSQTTQSNNEINICLLIFLVIVFWPAAIIYAVVKSKK